MPTALTHIERKILDFMVDYLKSNTYQPSIREIGERFGIKSTKTVSEHLQALADKGFLERDPSRSRGVRILGVNLNPDATSLPCFGELPDRRGYRMDRAESYLTLDRKLVSRKGAFAVRARGEALSVLGVREGDYLLVEPASFDEVEEGAVLVVRDGEGLVYRQITRNGRGVYLSELSPGRKLFAVEDPAEIEIVGRVSALIHLMDGRRTTDLSLTTH